MKAFDIEPNQLFRRGTDSTPYRRVFFKTPFGKYRMAVLSLMKSDFIGAVIANKFPTDEVHLIPVDEEVRVK